MKDVPNEFVNNLMENMYMGYGNNNLGFDPSENAKQSKELKSATPGKFTDAPAAGDAKSPKVTGNQENAGAASKASSYSKAESVSDPGSSPASNVGIPSNIANKWSMPKTLSDSKMVTTDNTSLNERDLQERVETLEDALSTILEALRRQVENAALKETRRGKKGSPKRKFQDKDSASREEEAQEHADDTAARDGGPYVARDIKLGHDQGDIRDQGGSRQPKKKRGAKTHVLKKMKPKSRVEEANNLLERDYPEETGFKKNPELKDQSRSKRTRLARDLKKIRKGYEPRKDFTYTAIQQGKYNRNQRSGMARDESERVSRKLATKARQSRPEFRTPMPKFDISKSSGRV